MIRFGIVGHTLIKRTPLTLLALTDHSIEPHEQDWFARCRGDYLRSSPLLLLELVRLLLLLTLVGFTTSYAYMAVVLAGWTVFMAFQIAVHRNEAVPGFDQQLALRNRQKVIRIRSVWWAVALAWGIAIAPVANHEGLVALGVSMMVIDGISSMVLPYLALAASVAGGCAVVAGLFARDGFAMAPVAIVVLVLILFLHSSIYNLYYLFATRRIRTRRLAESNETVQLLLNQYDDEGSDWLYETDREGRIQRPSKRFCDACGIDPQLLEGMPLTMLFHEGNHRHELQEKLDRAEPFRNLTVSLTVNGEERWWSITGRPLARLRGEEGGWRGFVADMSAEKQAEAKIAFLAHYDLLTSLPNRTLFAATLERELARLSPGVMTGLLFIDLDRFKEVNDGFGHSAGDALLAEVGRRLEKTVRPGDMVARLGGDEFAVLLPDLPSREAGIVIARRILKDMEEPASVEGQLMPLGASIGAAFAPDDGVTGDELLRSADLAMYDAKLRGRHGIAIFEDSMREQMQERRDLALGLRTAIVRGEMELYYQPLVDIATSRVTGYEALLRWHHPLRGLVPPDDFIPIAEETGLIVEIGEWVIRSALADLAQWPEHLTVAVNVSPAQMRDDRLVRLLANAFVANGVMPNRLELEITENLLIRNTEEVLALLHRLRKLGVRISLDDFGTGYSSLAYLHSFPFDKIKIDRSFIEGLVDREDCQAIVHSVIALANDLDMITTAEGVENESQLAALREKGCTQVQGYLFSEALPVRKLGFGNAADAEDRAAKRGNVVELPEVVESIDVASPRLSPPDRRPGMVAPSKKAARAFKTPYS